MIILVSIYKRIMISGTIILALVFVFLFYYLWKWVKCEYEDFIAMSKIPGLPRSGVLIGNMSHLRASPGKNTHFKILSSKNFFRRNISTPERMRAKILPNL